MAALIKDTLCTYTWRKRCRKEKVRNDVKTNVILSNSYTWIS